MRRLENRRHRRVRVARPIACGESRVEIRFLPVFGVGAWFPQREQLREVFQRSQRVPMLRLQLGKPVGALQQHPKADAFDLADAQSVAGLEQAPGGSFCGIVGLDVRADRRHGCRRTDVQSHQAECLQVVLGPTDEATRLAH